MSFEKNEHSPEEKKNIELVREYMEIAYDPKRASAEAVAHLCSPGNRFIAPTTFPGVNTLEEYAADHAKIMKQVSDLGFSSIDVLFAKGDRVCLRYTAQGSHNGEPHGDIPATGRKACWTASAIFRVENGKIKEFIKDWNKLSMWEQLGWPAEECLMLSREVVLPPPALEVRERPETSVH
jgi:predicted ester cyclase